MLPFFLGLVVGLILGTWAWPRLVVFLDYISNGER